MIKNKELDIKKLHILLIILGIVFVFIPIFHTNLWFDESYSVSIAEHSYKEIWNIGKCDVHPILYYWILHTISLFFGNKIIAYRIFSAICISILGILGFTHIRKDFDEKVGFAFSFLIYFLPVSTFFSGEIRMYSLGILLGTIMLIYAYRIYENKINKTTLIFFTLSSLSLAYTHYYGLMLAGIINLLLFIFLAKNINNRKKDFRNFLICAIIQVIIYMPWLICFLTQIQKVSKGFWITVSFPETLYEILAILFQGNLSQTAGILLSGIICTYVGYLFIEYKKEDRKIVTICLIIYLGIIISVTIISIIMHTVIFLDRYLVIISGLTIFSIAFIIQKDSNKFRKVLIFGIIAIISIINNFYTAKDNYNLDNSSCVDFIRNNIKDEEIIIYSDVIDGAVITTNLKDKSSNISYFYNKDNWNIHGEYRAFAPNMEIKESLDNLLENYNGRIWVIESSNTCELANQICNKYDLYKVEEKHFNQSYKHCSYTVELLNK